MPWKKLSTRQVYKNRWLEVTEDDIQIDSGEVVKYGVVHKKPFALIIPWDKKYLTLVGQYRYPIDRYSWEFPEGHLEHSSIEKTAREELREETGLISQKVEEVGIFHLAPGHHTQVCHVFLATGLIAGEPEREKSEQGMTTKKVTFTEFEQMVRGGTITDGPTIAAFGMIIANGLFTTQNPQE